jgi:L-2-hydroxyglutarate oxidase
MDDIEPARCGVRAMALGPDGEMLDDFKIEYQGNSMHVINSPSPAATASLAYGNEIATMAKEYFKLS